MTWRLQWHETYVLHGWLQVHVYDSHVEDGLVALSAVRREEGEVVVLAVRPSVLLKEVAAAQLRLALCAHKVLRVPHLPQSRDHLHRSRTISSKTRKDVFQQCNRDFISNLIPAYQRCFSNIKTFCLVIWSGCIWGTKQTKGDADAGVHTAEATALTQSWEGPGTDASSWWLTCPTTGFWQAEQFPLEDVWTPCRLRSDCSSPSILSSEPPDAGCGGTTGCGAAGTTGWTGGAGWENKGKQVNWRLWNSKKKNWLSKELISTRQKKHKKHDLLCKHFYCSATMFIANYNNSAIST